MKPTLVLSPVDRGRRQSEEAASASVAFIFVPVKPTPKPHPKFNLSGLFVGLIYSGLIAAFFTGLGYVSVRLSFWIFRKIVGEQ